MTDLITREQKITASVQAYVRGVLDAKGFPPDAYDWVEVFQYDHDGPLVKPMVGPGFDFDDPGRLLEMGSDLTERDYSIQVWVYGDEPTRARQLAHAIKFAAEGMYRTIPLLDIGQDPAPQVGYLEVLATTADAQIFPDPEPWQEHVWMTSIRVRDTYYASQA